MRGQRRYRRKACGLNFTAPPPRGKPPALEVTAVLLYVSGPPMNRTAKPSGVSTPSVMAWIERSAGDHARRPEPRGRAVVIELDEMGRYLTRSPGDSGSGWLGIVLRAARLTGSAAVAIEPPSPGRRSA